MIEISLRFLSGRYHATPWGRHVNEGAIEWPPSPWRLLRALVAAWKRTMPDLGQEEFEPIIKALVEPPEFVLPPASTGHTRHFMPWYKKGPADRTSVFDAFVAVPRKARLLVRWPDSKLESEQRQILARVLANLNTLGRSESWCEAEIIGAGDNSAKFVCYPLRGDAPRDHEIIRLLCPDSINALADDHVSTITTTTAGRGKNKKTIEKRLTIYDPAWNICMETLQLHEERFSYPPGARWVMYARPRDCFKIESAFRTHRIEVRPSRLHIARYAIDSTVLPLATETLPVAEAARRCVMGIFGRLVWRRLHCDAPYPADSSLRPKSEIFSGKDETGTALEGHRHAYYLPTDEDGDGRLDHITIFAAGGFGPDERRTLDLLRELKTGRDVEERHPLRLLLMGLGALGEYSPGPLRRSRTWISATPYIATRFAKSRGRNRIDMSSPEGRAAFLQQDLRSQLAAVRPDLAIEKTLKVTIEPLWDNNQVFSIASRWRTIQFKRFRRRIGDDGGRRLAGSFRLTFQEDVCGPIVLGWSSHFGMGLFMPER